MKKLVFLFLFFVPLSSYGFDYHGIKSGMSSEEVKNLTGCEYNSSCSWEEVGEDNIFNTTMGINPPDLFSVDFSYTSDSKLWRIQLSFRERSGASGVAQIRALSELYPDAEPQKQNQKLCEDSRLFHPKKKIPTHRDEQLQEVNQAQKQ